MPQHVTRVTAVPTYRHHKVGTSHVLHPGSMFRSHTSLAPRILPDSSDLHKYSRVTGDRGLDLVNKMLSLEDSTLGLVNKMLSLEDSALDLVNKMLGLEDSTLGLVNKMLSYSR